MNPVCPWVIPRQARLLPPSMGRSFTWPHGICARLPGAEWVSVEAGGCTAAIVVLMLSPAWHPKKKHEEMRKTWAAWWNFSSATTNTATPSLAGSSCVVTSKVYQQSTSKFLYRMTNLQILRRLRLSLGSSCFRIHSSARLQGKSFPHWTPISALWTRNTELWEAHSQIPRLCQAQALPTDLQSTMSYLGNLCTFLQMLFNDISGGTPVTESKSRQKKKSLAQFLAYSDAAKEIMRHTISTVNLGIEILR